ncbi:hypothetical protein [Thermogymnomonas acidicola]|uniref:glycoside hydrolase family 38 N-terminal domain-containing protein n=1 Tax=Thermogymnomonas acidicola TaxID=399579 RepID=UPI00094649BC|nr:hypothetical protein [Thermogymnomonas acidicola]
MKLNACIYFIGHCHIDAAWLWPYSETRRKVERSFLNVVKLYRDGYSFVYAQSSALYYRWLELMDSDLFTEIGRLVRSGLWLPVGGMWVESDTNLILGESLARQFLFGQRYFEQRLGRRARIGWLPDTFGFSAQLPQIMGKSGIGGLRDPQAKVERHHKVPSQLLRLGWHRRFPHSGHAGERYL